MHAYATNCRWRHQLMFLLSMLSMGLAWLIGIALDAAEVAVGVKAGSVSALAVFGGLWWAFNFRVWRLGVARRLLRMPDLNGEWLCTGRTVSENGEPASYPDWHATVTIRQSWTQILVLLRTSQSESRSIAASLYREDEDRYRLIYHYDNTPRVSEQPKLHRHKGLTELVFTPSSRMAEGSYFTDGDRLTVGEMTLSRNGVSHSHQTVTKSDGGTMD